MSLQVEKSVASDFVVKHLFTFPQEPVNELPLVEPQALAIDAEGHLFVVDTGNNRIIKFQANGDYIYAVGGFGWENEEFDRPLDLTVKTGLDIFIADYHNERICRYDINLNYISSFQADETTANALQFGFPSSVDISRHGELFISDNENDRILKLNLNGEPNITFGDFNWGEGQLELPFKIEISQKDLVYVSDRGRDEIVIFDYYGNYISRFGKDLLAHPGGLTWSDDGLLFVADSGHHRIVVFDETPQVVYQWGERGKKIGAFINPVDVAIFNKNIYVLDAGNNRIQVFELLTLQKRQNDNN